MVDREFSDPEAVAASCDFALQVLEDLSRTNIDDMKCFAARARSWRPARRRKALADFREAEELGSELFGDADTVLRLMKEAVAQIHGS